MGTSPTATDDIAEAPRGEQDSPEGPSEGPESSPSWWERPLRDRDLLLIFGGITLPILWMGYGTDIDVANVLETTDRIRSGSYEPSRTPGAPVFEVLVTALHGWGRFLAVNLATAGAAAALLIGIARLVRAWGHPNSDLLALAFMASPVMIIASTSMADFVWALAFFVWGALVHLGGWGRLSSGLVASVAAGVAFALAIGTRSSTAFVIVALLVADGWAPSRRARCLQTALVAFPLGAALFIPSWLAFDRTLEFLENEDGYRGLLNNLGLFLYKNYVMIGPAVAVVLAAGVLPATVRMLRAQWALSPGQRFKAPAGTAARSLGQAWNRDPMLRFGALALVLTQGLFFQLPWKLAHLLPSLFALLLCVGASQLGRRRRFLWVLAAAIAVNGVVVFRPLAPDEPSEATTGTWNPAITAGLLVNDIDCRAEYMHHEPTELNVDRAWSCALRPLRGPVDVG